MWMNPNCQFVLLLHENDQQLALLYYLTSILIFVVWRHDVNIIRDCTKTGLVCMRTYVNQRIGAKLVDLCQKTSSPSCWRTPHTSNSLNFIYYSLDTKYTAVSSHLNQMSSEGPYGRQGFQSNPSGYGSYGGGGYSAPQYGQGYGAPGGASYTAPSPQSGSYGAGGYGQPPAPGYPGDYQVRRSVIVAGWVKRGPTYQATWREKSFGIVVLVNMLDSLPWPLVWTLMYKFGFKESSLQNDFVDEPLSRRLACLNDPSRFRMKSPMQTRPRPERKVLLCKHWIKMSWCGLASLPLLFLCISSCRAATLAFSWRTVPWHECLDLVFSI